MNRFRSRCFCIIVAAAALLGGCRDDHHQRAPLAVADYRLDAIEQRVSRMDAADLDDEMLSVDGDAYARPAGAAFRDAVARFYDAAHPACLGGPSDGMDQDDDDPIAELKPPLEDFDALVARLAMTPLRRDLDLAWEKAALVDHKQGAPRNCATSAGKQSEIIHNAQAKMRDALDRMEAAMNAAAS